MKIAHVKICNYRNLKDIDIGLSDTVAVIGENNSGKSNFLKAITLPFLTDDNTHTSKRLSWTDINNESKERYYKKIIEIQKEIKDDKITVEQFIKLLPIVSVEVNIQARVACSGIHKEVVSHFLWYSMHICCRKHWIVQR